MEPRLMAPVELQQLTSNDEPAREDQTSLSLQTIKICILVHPSNRHQCRACTP